MNTKFRAWDEKYNRWDESPIICYPNEDFKKQGRAIQWFTDLTDINNNPIYQGDIVKYIPSDFASGGDIRVGAVIFCNYFNGWAVKDATNYSVYNLNVPFMGLNRIEVIGNIFENPELLK